MDEDLEAIADAQDKLTGVDKAVQVVEEVSPKLSGENPSCGDVVAVAEAAGNGEHLVIPQQAGLLNEAPDVDEVSLGPGEFPGVTGFEVAIGAGGPQNEYSCFRHSFGPREERHRRQPLTG